MQFRAAMRAEAIATPSQGPVLPSRQAVMAPAPTDANTLQTLLQASQSSRPSSFTSNPAQKQARALALLDDIMHHYETPPSVRPTQDTTSDTSQAGTSSENTETEAQREERLLEEDARIVDEELRRYLTAPVGLRSSVRNVEIDLVAYWEVSSLRITNMTYPSLCSHVLQEKEIEYPILFRLAMDVLPVQASSVPSERVFSSSSETDTVRRSRMSPALIEILQIMKYSFRQERLSFTDHWIPTEEELTALPLTLEDAATLMSSNSFEQILTHIAAHRSRQPPSFPID